MCGLKDVRELQPHTGLDEVVRESELWLAQWSLSGCSPDIAWSICFSAELMLRRAEIAARISKSFASVLSKVLQEVSLLYPGATNS